MCYQYKKKTEINMSCMVLSMHGLKKICQMCTPSKKDWNDYVKCVKAKRTEIIISYV